jgi:hypothetical protein
MKKDASTYYIVSATRPDGIVVFRIVHDGQLVRLQGHPLHFTSREAARIALQAWLKLRS